MPFKVKTACRHPTCPKMVDSDEGWCPDHKRAEQKRIDSNRGNATERGYNTHWRKARATYLKRHPLCVMCKAQGRVTAATVVDHIVPHKGDSALFWDASGSWQSLCKPHHDAKTAREAGCRAGPRSRAGGFAVPHNKG